MSPPARAPLLAPRQRSGAVGVEAAGGRQDSGRPLRRPERRRGRVAAGSRPAFLYHRSRCSNGPCWPRGRASSAPGCPGRVRSPSRRTSWPDRAWRPRDEAGVAHFMEHITFKGTAGLSVDALDQRGDRGRRRLVQRGDRPRIDRLLGPRARGASRRAPMDVLGELIVRPTLADARDRGRADRHHRGDPLLPGRPVRVLPDPVPERAVRRRAARPRDLRRRGRASAPCPRTTIRDFWRTTYRPANTVVAVAGDIDHAEAVELVAAAFGTGNGVVPGLRAGAGAARRPAGRGRQAPDGAGPARRRGPGAAARPSRQLDAGGPQRGARRRDEQPAVPVGARGARPRLRRRLGARRLRRCRARSRSRPASTRRAARGPRGDPRRAGPAARRARARRASSTKAKRYLAGGLELRMDETRHVASWIGGQEALHDRVLTLEEALDGRRRGRRRRRPGASPASSFHDDGLRLAAVAPRPATCAAWSAAAAGCRRDPMTDARRSRPSRRPGPSAAGRRRATPTSCWPALHLRLGSLALARAELETLGRARRRSTGTGCVDLAEVRWRTGDLPAPGRRRARRLGRRGRARLVALVVAAEAAAALGRPSEARRLAGQAAGGRATAPIDPVFAGMPRRASGRRTRRSPCRRRRRCSRRTGSPRRPRPRSPPRPRRRPRRRGGCGRRGPGRRATGPAADGRSPAARRRCGGRRGARHAGRGAGVLGSPGGGPDADRGRRRPASRPRP